MSLKKIVCEIYSRVVGYHRPVNQWNKGKQEEYSERLQMKMDKVKEKIKREEEKK